MVPYLNSESVYYQDSKLRRSLAGTLDCIVLGASQGSCAFVPEVLDSNLGVNSYNLSSALIPIHARKYLLEKELNRSNIKTVIIELSYNTLARNSTAEFGNGDTRVIEKLDSAQERIKYMLKYIKFNDWINVYSHLFMNSLNGIETFITDGGNNVDYKAKGFDSRKVSVGSINPKEVIKTYNTEKISTDYYENNVKVLTDIIDTCKTKNIRVIIAVAPLSDVLLWKYKNMDDFLSWATNYSNQQS
ncbi:MAG: hypothetical protein KBT46_05480, partial [Ruminococcus sp.]|nr:hypothetical protein [Candidatus Copronaster equi]